MFHSGPVQKIWSVRFSFFLERNSIKLLKSDFYMFQINVFLNFLHQIILKTICIFYLGYHRILRSTTMLYCDNKKDFMRMIYGGSRDTVFL